MSRSTLPAVNHDLDLVLERVVDVPAHLIWKAWTEPEELKPWFCPKPWRTTEAEIDLRPGGIFRNSSTARVISSFMCVLSRAREAFEKHGTKTSAPSRIASRIFAFHASPGPRSS